MTEPRIALVNVPYGTAGRAMRPLGLAALGAYLQSKGIYVEGYDFSHESLTVEQLIDCFSLHTYDIVGISIYNINIGYASALANELKKRNSSILIVVGGPHPSAAPEYLLRTHSAFDVVVRNEGEIAFHELIDAWQSKHLWHAIPGIAYRQLDGIHTTDDPVRITDLDSLPSPVFSFRSSKPPEDLYFYDRPQERIRSAVALVSSRSCPYRCSFCAIILMGRQWRARSAERIVDDIVALEAAAESKYEHVYFLDANFFVDAKRTIRVAEALQKFRPGITFSFSTRVNQLLRGKPYLERLVDLGLRAVEIGIESGSQAALNRFAKDTTVEQNRDAIILLRALNVELFLDFIMFDAEATLSDISANLRFLEQLGLDSYVPWDHLFSAMTPYVGTQIRDHYEQLLGAPFAVDELPDPATLFQERSVRSIYEELCKLLPLLKDLAYAVNTIEELIPNSDGEEKCRLLMNAAELRRLPYQVLQRLTRTACNGLSLPIQEAMPRFFDDRGGRVDPSEVISKYALHAN